MDENMECGNDDDEDEDNDDENECVDSEEDDMVEDYDG